MAIVKTPISLNFSQGIDTKTDSKQIPQGRFLSLQNTVFNKQGLLTKRNGFAALTNSPSNSPNYLTTLNGNLTAIGNSISALNDASNTWVNRGSVQPLQLSTQPVLRNNLNQSAVDTCIAPSGLMCTVYLEVNNGVYANKYVIANADTGQNIVAPTTITTSTTNTTAYGMRVFLLGSNFVIVYTAVVASNFHLRYTVISSVNPATATAPADISPLYVPASTLSWDGFVANNNLYVAYSTSSGIEMTYLTQSLILLTPVLVASGKTATMMSVTADVPPSGVNHGAGPGVPVIYASFYAPSTGYVLAVEPVGLTSLLAPTQIISSGTYLNITCAAQNSICSVFAEASSQYDTTGLPCNYIENFNVTFAGAVTSLQSIVSLGLASKAFLLDGQIGYLGAYASAYQSTYFLINGSTSTSAKPVIIGKVAYENGGGYLLYGLPSVSVVGNVVSMAYLYKDLIAAVNTSTQVPAGTQVNGIYSQTGINLANWNFTTIGYDTVETAQSLLLSGGFLGMYDGYLPVEHNFFLFPDPTYSTSTAPLNPSMATWSTTGGSMVAQPDGSTNAEAYFYQITYEWTDNNGLPYRSAPSVPIAVTTTGSGSTGSVSLTLPNLCLTMKTANPVKIVVYRWSVKQQVYYQVTSLTAPVLNSTTAASQVFVDTLADASILGNNIIYTNGSVVEDINAPATHIMDIFDTRAWLVDDEDGNLLYFSKQNIENVPVEFSDLFTIFVPPSTSTNISTGPMTALSPMDDKQIIFKANAIYYINGTGPDNTGANNNYSPAIYITSTVGCSNQQSIALMPLGLMFQSNKGIWLLDRNLQTSYIGAPVEDLVTGNTVLSAVAVPETNQVRFTLSNGITLMYDYYYGQWSSFVNIPGISSCIYQGLHTYLNSYGNVFQESPGVYLDGSSPTLISFQTGPLRLGDLQNYQRAFFFYLLGEFLSPHKIAVSMYYDYATSPSQVTILTPVAYNGAYGAKGPYGAGAYGGVGVEQFRVFLAQQRCQAISIGFQEIFDPSFGTAAGAGLTLSGINLLCAWKGKMPTLPSSLSFGN